MFFSNYIIGNILLLPTINQIYHQNKKNSIYFIKYPRQHVNENLHKKHPYTRKRHLYGLYNINSRYLKLVSRNTRV